jgi:hypothetical protein
MMFLISGCYVMDSKSITASVNISLNSGSEWKLTQLIVDYYVLIIEELKLSSKITDCRRSLMYVTTVFSTTPHKLSNVQQCHNK